MGEKKYLIGGSFLDNTLSNEIWSLCLENVGWE